MSRRPTGRRSCEALALGRVARDPENDDAADA